MGSRNFIFIFTLMVACSGQIFTTPYLGNPSVCNPTTPLPDTAHLICGSCRNRCNSITNLNPKVYCSCDSSCVAYGDCCIDFELTCPVQFESSSTLRAHFRYKKTECYTIRTVPFSERNIVGVRQIIPSFSEYNFVAICGQTGVVCNRTSPYNILEPNLAIPVTDTQTGVSYVNYRCAKCNNVVKVTPWVPQMACDPSIVSYNQRENFRIDTEEELRLYLPLCDVNYMIPQDVRVRSLCGKFNRKCSPTCKRTDLVNLCENSYTVNHIFAGWAKIYDNVYCALCAGESAKSLRCAFGNGEPPTHTTTQPTIFPTIQPTRYPTLYPTTYPTPAPTYIPTYRPTQPKPGLFSLSLLFDFDPSNGFTVGRKAYSVGQKWISASQECRQVKCPGDLRLVEKTCLPTVVNLELSASLFFNFTKDLNMVNLKLEKDKILAPSLTNQLENLLIKDDKLVISLNQSKISDHMINLTIEMTLLFNRNSTFNLESDLVNFSETAIHTFNDELILLVQRSGINIANVIIMINDILSFKQATLVDCTWFEFSNEEFTHQNNTLTIISRREPYSMERYRLVSKGALVCISNEESNSVRLDVSQTLGILTLVLVPLSVICLLVRLILHFRIPYYQTFAGKLHFNLCLSLCLAFCMLIPGGVVSTIKIMKLCKAFGSITYWLFLTAFFWMSAVIFDTWLVFRPSATFVRVDKRKKSLIKYVLPCWLIPALIAIAVTCLDFTNVDLCFQPQFGINLCWFNQRYALLVYFGVPVAFLTIFMTVFFILTVLSLKKTMNSSSTSTGEKESHNIWIYFRLYVLMGISWIFGFVAAFVGHDALWIVFIILKSSQGILIFISFVLNRKVLSEIKALGKGSTHAGTSATGSTEPPSSSDHLSSHIHTAKHVRNKQNKRDRRQYHDNH